MFKLAVLAEHHAFYVIALNLFATRFHPGLLLSTAMDTKIEALHRAGRAAVEKAAKFLLKDAEAPPEVLRCECLQRSYVAEYVLCVCVFVCSCDCV